MGAACVWQPVIWVQPYELIKKVYCPSPLAVVFGVTGPGFKPFPFFNFGHVFPKDVIGGHVYLHLQNRRFTCIDLATGERTWTSKPFGKYASLVAQEDKILALDASGRLLLIQANPSEFEMLDEREISESETWAHLAVSDDTLFVRELDALSAYRWATGGRP